MRDVYVVGAGMTRFGRAGDWTLVDVLEYAAVQALKDAGLDRDIESVFIANMGAGILNHLSGLGSAMVDRLCLLPASAETVENGPASGGPAVKIGAMAVGSGAVDTATKTP